MKIEIDDLVLTESNPGYLTQEILGNTHVLINQIRALQPTIPAAHPTTEAEAAPLNEFIQKLNTLRKFVFPGLRDQIADLLAWRPPQPPSSVEAIARDSSTPAPSASDLESEISNFKSPIPSFLEPTALAPTSTAFNRSPEIPATTMQKTLHQPLTLRLNSGQSPASPGQDRPNTGHDRPTVGHPRPNTGQLFHFPASRQDECRAMLRRLDPEHLDELIEVSGEFLERTSNDPIRLSHLTPDAQEFLVGLLDRTSSRAVATYLSVLGIEVGKSTLNDFRAAYKKEKAQRDSDARARAAKNILNKSKDPNAAAHRELEHRLQFQLLTTDMSSPDGLRATHTLVLTLARLRRAEKPASNQTAAK